MIKRHMLLSLLLLAYATLAYTALAQGQGYPNQPIRLIVPWPPGGGVDTTGRMISTPLSQRLGQSIVVDNRAGAGGNIGTEFAKNQKADGYTLLMGSISPNAVNIHLYSRLGFDPVKDFAPITFVSSVPNILVVPADSPFNSVQELIAYAKANPGKLNMASAGIGGPQHVAGELFKFMAGVDLTHIPYKGTTPAVTDLVAGQVQVMFDVTPTSLAHIKAGKLRPLGVTTTEPLPFLPDVPTIDSFLKGYEAAAWIGFGAPKGTPPEIIATLNKQTNAAVLDPNIQQRFAALGVVAVPPNSPNEFAKFIAENIEKWTKVIKFAGIKPE